MGQQEVYEILKNRRLSGDDKFYSVAQLRRHVFDNPEDTNSIHQLSKAVVRLHNWGLIEKRTVNNAGMYRFKKSVLE